MSESLAVRAHGVRFSNISDDEASLQSHPESPGPSRDDSTTHDGGMPSDHNLAVREALGRYALAMGIEGGLDQARDAIMRLLGEARAETHEAWTVLDGALAEEAASDGGTER
jgi:hypothetical protein